MYYSLKHKLQQISNLLSKRISTTSLQFRLTMELSLISIVGLSIVSVWVGWRMEKALISSQKQVLENVVTLFPEQVTMYMEMGGIKEGVKRTVNKAAAVGLSVSVQSPDGQMLAQAVQKNSPDSMRIAQQVVMPTQPTVIQFGDRYVIVCRSPLNVAGNLVGNIYLSQDVTQAQLQLNSGIYSLVAVNMITIAIIIMMITYRIRKSLYPIAQMSEIASVVSLEDLNSAKLQLTQAPDEIRGLAQAFNEMLWRLSGSWEQQRQFVGNVSHELRTPLTVICGYLQSLLRRGGNLSDYQKQALETASAETERTIQMLQDLLDLARADSGNLHFRQSPVFLHTLVAEVAAMSEKVSDRSVRVIIASANDSDTDDIVALADQDRLQQVLINIVDNAIKYSAEPVEIMLERSEDQAIIHVCDRGIGISLQHQQRIFERFYRADEASTRSRDGTGLGLAIAKSLIEGMQGRISLRSKPNEGSIFTIALPLWEPKS